MKTRLGRNGERPFRIVLNLPGDLVPALRTMQERSKIDGVDEVPPEPDTLLYRLFVQEMRRLKIKGPWDSPLAKTALKAVLSLDWDTINRLSSMRLLPGGEGH